MPTAILESELMGVHRMRIKLFGAVSVLSLSVAVALSGCSAQSDASVTGSADSCERQIVTGMSAYELWLSQGNEGTVDDFFAALVGAQGADGYSGSDGVNGAPGAPGKAGESAYQLWLNLGNTGTPTDFLNSIAGAAGATGLSGLSAYQLWLSLGNSGTTQEFIDSLKGETGASGTPGATGATGATGAQGLPGLDGICTVGDTGVQGPAGPVGPIGPSGSPGPTGAQGATGAQGPQGDTGPQGPALTPTEVSYTLGGGTIAGTQPTFNGAPMFYGAYVQTGATVFFNVSVVMTNITNFGTGQYYVTLPFASKYSYSTSAGRITDSSSGRAYTLHGYAAAGSNVLLLTYDSGAQQVAFDYNSPVTLTTTDVFVISGTYIVQ